MARRNSGKDKLLSEVQAVIPWLPTTYPDGRAVYYSEEQLELFRAIAANDFSTKTKRVKEETDTAIDKRIKRQMMALEIMVDKVLTGDPRYSSLVVSGPGGLGKTYLVEQKLKEWDPNGERYTIHKGMVRATGLYKTLWDHRMPGQVLVFDDADAIWFDDVALNLLKASCDINPDSPRTVSYLSETVFMSEKDSATIPKRFTFEGTIIFISNYDFDDLIANGNRIAPHLAAMMSRAHYIDCGMKNRRDYCVRIEQLLKVGLISKVGGRELTEAQKREIMDFVKENKEQWREVSARLTSKIATYYVDFPKNWKDMAIANCVPVAKE